MRSRNIIILAASFLITLMISTAAAGAGDPHRFDRFFGTDWYGVYMQGAKIGYASTEILAVNRPVEGWRMQNNLTMIINIMGKIDTTTSRDTRIFSSPGSEMYSNMLSISSGTGSITVEGKKEADEYIIKTNIGGQPVTRAFAYPLDYLDSLMFLQAYMSSGKAAVGDSLAIAMFEPSPPLTGTVHQSIKIDSESEYMFNGVPTEVYTLQWSLLEAGMGGRNVIDKDGTDLEVDLGGGILMKLEPEHIAKSLDLSYDILSDNLIHPDRKLGEPGSLEMLKIRIDGIGEDDLINSKSQSVTVVAPETLMVEIRRSELPRRILEIPIESAPLLPFLKPDAFTQSDDPEIVSRAREIVGDEKDSWAAARKINAWVYNNIRKQFTPDISNALQTLHSGQGDCGEHAVLAVALMRAAGIPAREVTGLVYWPPGEGFGYHAWIEVYVGDWIMMDPSWGEDIINPAHIAMTSGDILNQVSVLSRVIGKVGIEIVDSK